MSGVAVEEGNAFVGCVIKSPIAARCDACPCRGVRVSMLGGRAGTSTMGPSVRPGNRLSCRRHSVTPRVYRQPRQGVFRNVSVPTNHVSGRRNWTPDKPVDGGRC